MVRRESNTQFVRIVKDPSWIIKDPNQGIFRTLRIKRRCYRLGGWRQATSNQDIRLSRETRKQKNSTFKC